MKAKYLNYIICFLLGVVLVSCSLERKIANNFIKSTKKNALLVFFPSDLIKTNIKQEQLGLADSILLNLPDSLNPAKSIYLPWIDDSVLMNTMKQSMLDELSLYGFQVYGVDNMSEFLALNDSSYVLNLAQIELEEYILKASADDFFDAGDYNFKVDVNALNLNAWFELNRNLVPTEKYPVLYSSYYIYEDVKGSFYQSFDGKMSFKFRYKIDSLNVKDIYKLAELSGKKYAINFYDYLLNLYVQDHMPKGQIPAYYYHYFRQGKVIQTWYNDSFTEMDP